MDDCEGSSFPEAVEPKLSCAEVLVSEGWWVETAAATGWLWTEILFLLQQNSWYFQAWDIARGVRCGLVPPLQPSWVLPSTFGRLLDCVPPHFRCWGQGGREPLASLPSPLLWPDAVLLIPDWHPTPQGDKLAALWVTCCWRSVPSVQKHLPWLYSSCHMGLKGMWVTKGMYVLSTKYF